MCKKLVLVEQHNVGIDAFYTTPLFWDCECERGFIHPCTEEQCCACNATQEESPNSRVDEVFNHSNGLNKILLATLEFVCNELHPELVPIPF